MNLLKLTFLVIFTASIALLLSNQATALDHPWDDRPTDTTTATSTDNIDDHPEVGDNNTPESVDEAVFLSINFWLHWFFGGIDSYVIEQQVQQAPQKPERGRKHLSGRVVKLDYR